MEPDTLPAMRMLEPDVARSCVMLQSANVLAVAEAMIRTVHQHSLDTVGSMAEGQRGQGSVLGWVGGLMTRGLVL